MVRKSVSAAVTVALCLMSASQAVAQEYRFTGFDPPQGATATVNLRVPIGDDHRRQPTYGLTFGYGYDLGGPNMNGRSLEQARGDALAKGFTINALAIRRPGSGRPGGPGGMSLEDYYGQSVIGGPGSFVEIADEMRPFALAARRKLLTEIAGTGGRSRHANR